MTPQAHLDLAEHNLEIALENSKAGNYTGENACLLYAIAHALIAHAAESGVFHYSPPVSGGEPGAG